MEIRIKYIFIAIIGIFCFTVLILYNFGIFNELDTSQQNGEDDNVSNESEIYKENVSNIDLTVDYKNGSKKIKENFSLTNGNTSAFDALNKWCEIKYDDYGDKGFLVTSIDGLSGDWLYYVNGDYAGTASNKYALNDGDTIEWIYSS